MLKALALVLADQIDSGLPPKDLGPIAKQISRNNQRDRTDRRDD